MTTSYLKQHPVDMLVLENLDKRTFDLWIKRIPGLQHSQTPKIIFEFWEPWRVTRNVDGPMAKLTISR
jgi:hypothetical protein